MKRPRVLLADDHRIVAEGLRSLIEPEFELVGIAEDGRALVEASDKLRPDVVVVDISMPRLNGIDAVRQIKKSHPRIRIVFLTMHRDITYTMSAMEAGALGYVLKHSAPEELAVAIRSALRGKTYVTPSLSGAFVKGQKKGSPERITDAAFLTRRQREVLQLLAEGLCMKEIASMLEISTRTVEYHKYQMMKDLGLKSVSDLVRYAVRHGIIIE